MVCGAGKNIWTPLRKSGRIPSTRFSVSIENEQADKRRYSQTCLAKPNSQARTGARKFSPVQLTINRIGNLTQLICTLLYVMTTHTCIIIIIISAHKSDLSNPWSQTQASLSILSLHPKKKKKKKREREEYCTVACTLNSRLL